VPPPAHDASARGYRIKARGRRLCGPETARGAHLLKRRLLKTVQAAQVDPPALPCAERRSALTTLSLRETGIPERAAMQWYTIGNRPDRETRDHLWRARTRMPYTGGRESPGIANKSPINSSFPCHLLQIRRRFCRRPC